MGTHNHLEAISTWSCRTFTSRYYRPHGLMFVFPILKSYPFHPANGSNGPSPEKYRG